MCGEAGLQTIRDITCLCSVQTTSLCKYFSPPWRQRCNFQPPIGLVAPAMEMKRKQPREEIPTASKVGDHPFPSKYLSQDCIRFYYQDQDKGILQHIISSKLRSSLCWLLIGCLTSPALVMKKMHIRYGTHIVTHYLLLSLHHSPHCRNNKIVLRYSLKANKSFVHS